MKHQAILTALAKVIIIMILVQILIPWAQGELNFEKYSNLSIERWLGIVALGIAVFFLFLWTENKKIAKKKQ